MSAIGCQAQSCPFRFRRGVYHCGPCHCLDDIPIEKRAQLRRWIYDMRDAAECCIAVYRDYDPIEVQTRTTSAYMAWKAGAKLAGDRTEDA